MNFCYNKPIMEGLKKVVKKALPAGARRKVANWFHFLEAVGANVRYGFPARGMQVVMITGTNGKTTTASFLASILKEGGRKVGTWTTAYYEVNGQRFANEFNATNIHPMILQEKLAEMKKHGTDTLVLEVTSHALEQSRVWGIPCEVAIITNLTQDHLDYHGTMEKYAAAKARLLQKKPRFIVLNHDDEWFNYFDQFPPGEQSITYGTHVDADVRLTGAQMHREGSRAEVEVDHQTNLELIVHLPGQFNVYNAMAASAAAYLLHIDTESIEAGVDALQTVPGRQERIDEGQPYEVLVDYAHTPDAMEQLLSSLAQLSSRRLVVVFGATGDRDKGKRPIMGEIVAKYADRIFVTDEESYTEDPASIRKMVLSGIEKAGAEAKTEEIADRRQAIEKALSIARRGDTVVITGMGHEKFRIIDGRREPWSDGGVVREILEG